MAAEDSSRHSREFSFQPFEKLMHLLDRRQAITGVRPARAPHAHCNAARERAKGRLVHEVVTDKNWHYAGTGGRQIARPSHPPVSPLPPSQFPHPLSAACL